MSDEKLIKVLLVDDEVKLLESVSERLSLRDFEVTTATDGKKAIKAAKGDKFDVAIVDLRMPGMDGTEVLKTLKKRHKWLEVIILTGYGSIDSAAECTRLGAFGYLEKPADFDKLIDVLKQAYTERLKKKFKRDQKRMEDIEFLSMGASPMSILASLRRLDDDEK
jgi:DNA-binding NtrC family response regulator